MRGCGGEVASGAERPQEEPVEVFTVWVDLERATQCGRRAGRVIGRKSLLGKLRRGGCEDPAKATAVVLVFGAFEIGGEIAPIELDRALEVFRSLAGGETFEAGDVPIDVPGERERVALGAHGIRPEGAAEVHEGMPQAVAPARLVALRPERRDELIAPTRDAGPHRELGE